MKIWNIDEFLKFLRKSRILSKIFDFLNAALANSLDPSSAWPRHTCAARESQSSAAATCRKSRSSRSTRCSASSTAAWASSVVTLFCTVQRTQRKFRRCLLYPQRPETGCSTCKSSDYSRVTSAFTCSQTSRVASYCHVRMIKAVSRAAIFASVLIRFTEKF